MAAAEALGTAAAPNAATTYDDAPLPKPSARAAKWIGVSVLLIAFAAGGAWLILAPPGAAVVGAAEADSSAPMAAADTATTIAADAAVATEPDTSAPADRPDSQAVTDGGAAPDTPVDTGPAAPAAPVLTAVRIASVPTGALIRVGGVSHGKTPHTLMITQGTPLRATLSHEGYRGREVLLIAGDAPSRTINLTKVTGPRRPRPARRVRVEPAQPPRDKVKSALEERL